MAQEKWGNEKKVIVKETDESVYVKAGLMRQLEREEEVLNIFRKSPQVVTLRKKFVEKKKDS
jgi:hypothetical protein